MMRFTKFAVAGAVLTLLATGCETDNTGTTEGLGNSGSGGNGGSTNNTGGSSDGGSSDGGSSDGGSNTGGTSTGGTSTGGTNTGGGNTGGSGGGNVDPPTQCEQQIQDPIFNSEACDSCMKKECCDSIMGCLGDQGCVDLVGCMQDQQCQDDACLREQCADVFSEDALERLMNFLGNTACIGSEPGCGDECA